MWSNLGTGYFARKDYVRAWESWQHALSLDPEVFESRSTQGVLLQERSVEERAKFHFYLAKTYAKAGNVEARGSRAAVPATSSSKSLSKRLGT